MIDENRKKKIEERAEELPEPVKTMVKGWIPKLPEDLPEKPEKNTWYHYAPEGCICSNGDEYYGSLKIGTENNLIICFSGGGVAIDDFSAARPNTYAEIEGEPTFYFKTSFIIGDLGGHEGIGNKDIEKNPFRNWSYIFIPYATGDFHCGNSDHKYKDTGKGEGIIHYNGYKNTCAMVKKIAELIPNPDKLLITGFSAGAFGTGLMSDTVIDFFPKCEDITIFPDSGYIYCKNWRDILINQWNAPEKIYGHVYSEDVTADNLIFLHNKYGKRVKIAYGCSIKDGLLAQACNYAEGYGMVFTKESGVVFKGRLIKTVERLQKEIPDLALFIFDRPNADLAKYELTDHCFAFDDRVFDLVVDGISASDWLFDIVNGKSQQLGLGLLQD